MTVLGLYNFYVLATLCCWVCVICVGTSGCITGLMLLLRVTRTGLYYSQLYHCHSYGCIWAQYCYLLTTFIHFHCCHLLKLFLQGFNKLIYFEWCICMHLMVKRGRLLLVSHCWPVCFWVGLGSVRVGLLINRLLDHFVGQCVDGSIGHFVR